MSERILCIYHGNCADGFTAAWAVWKRFPDAEFVPGVYGQEPPNVARRRVVLVDFSYPEPVLRRMAEVARSLLVLDHHKTAAEALAWMPKSVAAPSGGRDPWTHHITEDAYVLECQGHPVCAAWFDMQKSGARLAWEFFHPAKTVPKLVQHVEDRDLWRFAIEGTREVQAVVFSHPYDFKTWNWLAARCEVGLSWQEMVNEGAGIERKHFKDVAELLAVTRRTMRIAGIEVPVANLPYTMASDAAGKLAEDAPFGACYYDKAGARVFSLRSRGDGGADVSAVAKVYGGGGHKNAAGFQAPAGWEGDAA